MFTTSKQRLVRELPENRRRTEVSVSSSGSAGAVGGHNNTQSIFPDNAAAHIWLLRHEPSWARRNSDRNNWRIPMKFRPLHDRVVVTRIDAEDKTSGGIIIPDTAKEKPSEGEIIAVGPGGRDENGKLVPIDLKADDRVLFGKEAGTAVKIDGDNDVILQANGIIGVRD